ncbi:hypothetical protein ACG9YX_15190 [Acinetobacter nematophilus]
MANKEPLCCTGSTISAIIVGPKLKTRLGNAKPKANKNKEKI